MSLPRDLQRAAAEDARECARHAKRYEFDRLSSRRIVNLLREKARQAGESLPHTDWELVEEWFAEFDKAVRISVE